MLSALRAAERLWLCNMIRRKACQTPSQLQPHILIISRQRGRERCGSCDGLRQQVRYQSRAFLHLWAAGAFRGHGFSLTNSDTFFLHFTPIWTNLYNKKQQLRSFLKRDIAVFSYLQKEPMQLESNNSKKWDLLRGLHLCTSLIKYFPSLLPPLVQMCTKAYHILL